MQRTFSKIGADQSRLANLQYICEIHDSRRAAIFYCKVIVLQQVVAAKLQLNISAVKAISWCYSLERYCENVLNPDNFWVTFTSY